MPQPVRLAQPPTEAAELIRFRVDPGAGGSAPADPIAIRLREAAGLHTGASLAHVLGEAERLFVQHKRERSRARGWQALLELVPLHPEAERLQLLVARLVEAAGPRDLAVAVWNGMIERFPQCHEAILLRLRWMVRDQGWEAARSELRRWATHAHPDPSERLLQARAQAELGDQTASDSAFAALLLSHPGFEAAYLTWARVLERRGLLRRACTVLERADTVLGPSRGRAAWLSRLKNDLAALDSYPKSSNTPEQPAGNIVLSHLLACASAGRVPPGTTATLGRIVLVTGTLGAGGAERQLVNTALALQAAVRQRQCIGGVRLAGPIEVACRSVTVRPGADFFLPALQAAGIDVTIWPHDESCADEQSMQFLPREIAGCTHGLTRTWSTPRPDIVHLWQDGSILAAGLAALRAQVPRIILSVRTAPPIDRPERDRPEYAVLYPALLRCPGVRLVANSRHAAGRYAGWLDIALERVSVIHNGVVAPDAYGTPASIALARNIDDRLGPGFTVGTVIRFDANKRPFLWIEAAAALLARMQDARFVMVGDGPLRDAAERYAHRLGLTDRILFPGRVADVGFWLRQFDTFLLLSRQEGLPNVLIEAQHAGVPVVTTPAGGAAETVRDVETGFVLSSAEAPSIDEIVDCVATLQHAAYPSRSQAARAFVEQSFSTVQMVERTVALYCADDVCESAGPVALRPYN